ncbi:CXXC motif containing zinc binding protein [Balamuthia mandrillaris]
MPRFVLKWSADLEGVARVSPSNDIRYYLKLKCNNCGEQLGNDWIYVTPLETAQVTGSRGSANLVVRCKFCKREHSLDIEGAPSSLEKSGKMTNLVMFECRGLEPIEWDPRNGFDVQTESGTAFSDVNLSEDWCEFDEEANESVGIYNLKWSIDRQ